MTHHHKLPHARPKMAADGFFATLTRCRNNHFWFTVFALFVLWYLLLYVHDWSFRISNVDTAAAATATEFIHSTENPSYFLDEPITFTHPEKIGQNPIDLIPTDEIPVPEKELKPPALVRQRPRPNFEPPVKQRLRRNTTVENRRIKREPKRSCKNRYIYVHDLPTRFNLDFLEDCLSLSQWSDMCRYLTNSGMGPFLGNPQNLFSDTGWFITNQFSLEVIFHNRMKQYECLTNDSSKAAAVFVPYYAGLDVARFLWGGFNTSVRDADAIGMAKWLTEKPEWKTMYGKDHFFIAGRITWDFRRGIDDDDAWGNKLMLLPEVKNMTVLTIESSPWNENDFGIPYPTYFHPSDDGEIVNWQAKMRKIKRKTLFSFAGAPRAHLEGSIRGEVIAQCAASKRRCKLLQCGDNNLNKCYKPFHVMKMFQGSVFCLQPPGDSYTRRSTFDSILAGCIPVFFTPGSAYVQYLWHLPRDFFKYSILIPEDDVKGKRVSIERVLSRVSRARITAMREEVIKLIPKVVYADPRSRRLEAVEDAFDLAVKGVLERVERERRRENVSDGEFFDEEYSWKYHLFGNFEKHEWDHYFARS